MSRLPLPSRRALRLLPLLAVLLVAFPVSAQEQTGKPRISARVRTLMEQQGPMQAQMEFSRLFVSERDAYDFDADGLAELSREYMRAGDVDKAKAALGMATMVDMRSPEVHAAREELKTMQRGQRQQRSAERLEARRTEISARRGPARDDLGRFAGEYGNSSHPGRTFFVTRTCDGHLAVGAMWGDVAPWVMKPLSDTEFAEPRAGPSGTAIGVSFDAPAGGNATAMRFSAGFEDWGTLQRTGDLKPGFRECIQLGEG